MYATSQCHFVTTRKLQPTNDDFRTACADGVYSYSHRPMPIFYGGKQETALMYGVELELDQFTGDIRPGHLARYLHSKFPQKIYCKSDGSLGDGVEVVSHPATLSYHMRKFGWADVLGAARDAGAQSHDAMMNGRQTCGLHVHVGRLALGNTPETRELCIAKVLILMDRFYDSELKNFSRRDDAESLRSWAKKSDANITPGDKRPAVLRKAKEASCNHDRYHALNLTNHATIEFRIFRGTLNPTTFAATLQFVDAIVRYCKTNTLPQIMACSFADIVDVCKYPELAEYCRRRGIGVHAAAMSA